jgi:hypothetical protein
MQGAGRPLTLTVEAADTALEAAARQRAAAAAGGAAAVVEVECAGDGPLYVEFLPRSAGGVADAGALLTKFRVGAAGETGALQRDGRVVVGDALVSVNGADVERLPFGEVVEAIKTAGRPLTLGIQLLAPPPQTLAAQPTGAGLVASAGAEAQVRTAGGQFVLSSCVSRAS